MQQCDNLKCGGTRVLQISGKVSDLCTLNFKGVEHNGEVPSDLVIGGGDYLEMDICLDCGKAQGIENVEDPDFYTDSIGGDLEEEGV